MGIEVNLESNFAEHLAKVVLPSDEIPLAKKNRGQVRPERRPLGQQGRALPVELCGADLRADRERACLGLGVLVAQVAKVIDMNADARRKEAVRLATAKRAPSRKLRKCVGAVAL